VELIGVYGPRDGKRIDTYFYEFESCTRLPLLCSIACMFVSVIFSYLGIGTYLPIYLERSTHLSMSLDSRVRVGVSDRITISPNTHPQHRLVVIWLVPEEP
jgi:hypothetical protein